MKIMKKIKAPVLSNDLDYLYYYFTVYPKGYFLRHCETCLENHECPYIKFGCKACTIRGK